MNLRLSGKVAVTGGVHASAVLLANIERQTPLRIRSEAGYAASTVVFFAPAFARHRIGQTVGVRVGFAMPR